MPKLPSLPDGAHLSDLVKAHPQRMPELMTYTDALLRAEGTLSIGEREMIAAYVSGRNACTFCFGAHRLYAEAFGIDEGLLDAMVADLESAPVDDRMKALLRYLDLFRTLPAQARQADLDAVLAQGWSESAVVEAVEVMANFHMMNRIIEATGITFDYAADDSTHPARKLGADVRRHSYVGTPMGHRKT
jgi:uncharacterized peroxidase-related enzyme